MGILYHALVELAQSKLVHSQALGGFHEHPTEVFWRLFAVVELGKNHAFSNAIGERAKRGWPSNPCLMTENYRKKHFAEEGFMWCSAEDISRAINSHAIVAGDSLDDEDFYGKPRALEALLAVMKERPWVKGVRVLFYQS